MLSVHSNNRVGSVVCCSFRLTQMCNVPAGSNMKLLALVLLLAVALQESLAAKILALCTVASHSHSLWCHQYLSLLAEKGHQITVLGVDEPKINIPNLKKFIFPGVYDALYNSTDKLDPSTFTAEQTSYSNMMGFAEWDRISSTAILNSFKLKELINHYKGQKKPFDLVILDNGCCTSLLGLVPMFGNPPILLATTYGSPQWMTFRVGNVFNPAYVPSMVSSTDQKMTFLERCQNVYNYFVVEYVYKFVMKPVHEKLKEEIFGKELLPLGDIAKQSNIIIVNHHPALHDPRPLLPGVIGIAGLHIPEKPRPLPQQIKEFLDGAKEGAILLSFGTNVKADWLPKDFDSIVLKGLEQLPQRVLWKWDKNVPNLPKNVLVSKWLPQGDMMVHPNMRLFVSHCGLLSIQEAIYHKIPLLALPVFLDQKDNAAMLVRRNLTIQLNVFKLTSEVLREGIQEVLSNPVYKKNMERLGDLMRDMPQTARQQAVFWTEYAIRHQGAPHLRAAAADMPWYQLLLLDVLALAILIAFVALWLVKALLNFVLRTLCASKNKKD